MIKVHLVRCPRCKFPVAVKNGHNKQGKQRYMCKWCGYQYITERGKKSHRGKWKSRSFSIWAVFSTPLSRCYIKNSASGGFAKPLLPSPTGTGLWNNSCVFFHMFPRKRLLSARATLRFQCPPSVGYLWVLLAVLSPIMGIVSTCSYCWFPVPFRNYDNPALGSATQPRQPTPFAT